MRVAKINEPIPYHVKENLLQKISMEDGGVRFSMCLSSHLLSFFIIIIIIIIGIQTGHGPSII